MKAFLKRKNIVFSAKRYGIDALSAMAQGLFCSLLIGTIVKTIGQQLNIPFLIDVGGYCSAMSGPAMAVAIGYALQAPPLVLFSLATVGYAANTLGSTTLSGAAGAGGGVIPVQNGAHGKLRSGADLIFGGGNDLQLIVCDPLQGQNAVAKGDGKDVALTADGCGIDHGAAKADLRTTGGHAVHHLGAVHHLDVEADVGIIRGKV